MVIYVKCYICKRPYPVDFDGIDICDECIEKLRLLSVKRGCACDD